MADVQARAELLASLRCLSHVLPPSRVAQLLDAVGNLCNDLHGRQPWDAEDEALFEEMWNIRRETTK